MHHQAYWGSWVVIVAESTQAFNWPTIQSDEDTIADGDDESDD